MPIDVPSPPLSLITTVVRDGGCGVVGGHLDVGERVHVERLDRRLGDHAGLAVLEEPEVVGERLDGDLVHPGGRHLLARPVQTWTAHASIVGWPGGSAATTREDGPAKTAVRDQVLAARRRSIPSPDLGVAARAIADHLLADPEVRRAATVAAYVSVGREPGTARLLDALRAAGKRVILPVLLPDLDLDWAVYDGRDSLAPAGRGLLEPIGPRLGVDAVATADVVLVPGLAVSADGHRLGRGGGSYDRALARVPVGTFTCVLLYDDEVGRRRARRAPRPHRHRAARRRRGGSASRSAPGGRRLRARNSRGATRPTRGRSLSSVELSVSSAASSTASTGERPRQRLAVDVQVGLVGVVAVDGWPETPVRLIQRESSRSASETTIRIDGAAVTVVALAGVPRRRVRRCEPPPPTSQPPRLKSHSTAAMPGLAERLVRRGRAGAGDPSPTRRGCGA